MKGIDISFAKYVKVIDSNFTALKGPLKFVVRIHYCRLLLPGMY